MTPRRIPAPTNGRRRSGVDAIGWHEFTVVAWVDRFAPGGAICELKAERGTGRVARNCSRARLLVSGGGARADQTGSAPPTANRS